MTRKLFSPVSHGDRDPDIETFMKPSQTNPWAADEHSTVGYNAKFSDAAGSHDVSGSGIDRSEDYDAFARPSTTNYDIDYPHQGLSRLIDDQADMGSGSKLLGGGGDVSKNQVGGVGYDRPRSPNKLSTRAIHKNPESLGGINRQGTRGRGR
jgi:hypothetical protein